ncbi:PLP-dependent aminotransferase family protein, partial [Klebsiella pneumoniae]
MGRIAVSDGGRVVWNLLSVTGGRNALLPEEPRMIRHLLHVDFQPGRGLQEQVRETLVNAILSGIFAADTPLPSCRQ